VYKGDMSGFTDDQGCFVCGSRNQQGLHLEFSYAPESGEATAEVAFPPHLQGWSGLTHGGLLATVLDEAMIKAAAGRGWKCVTRQMTVSYLRPVPTVARYHLRGTVVRERGKLVLAESALLDGQQRVVGSARGKLFKV